ncbi:hypothetical protein SNEBB_005921 [Seison nebaliae]|nr:hypothetical protein SNEBB_005921 [Seison nebaliae]
MFRTLTNVRENFYVYVVLKKHRQSRKCREKYEELSSTEKSRIIETFQNKHNTSSRLKKLENLLANLLVVNCYPFNLLENYLSPMLNNIKEIFSDGDINSLTLYSVAILL